jgi:RNA polymerase sigma factor (sigma-70 family)
MHAPFDTGEEIKSIVKTYSPGILRLTFAYLKNHSDAEDIAQEVFVAYIQKRPRFDSEAKKKSWLLTVTANKCKNELKSAKDKRTEAIDDNLCGMPEEDLGILQTVLSLDEKYRIPIHLYYYEGYKINEIAELTNSNAATVGTRLARGRSLLRTMIGDELDG